MEGHLNISSHRNGENLHLKLCGDFNTAGAEKLFSKIKEFFDFHAEKKRNTRNLCSHRIFIHTDC